MKVESSQLRRVVKIYRLNYNPKERKLQPFSEDAYSHLVFTVIII